MNKIIILGILVMLLLFSSCTNMQREPNYDDKHNLVRIYPKCEDRVICYIYMAGYAGGLSCFIDEQLVSKYCGTIATIKVEIK